jgi:short-subunit dehydrogenase
MADSRPFAVITGASSGIGRELARQFATHGFDLLITAEGGDLDAFPNLRMPLIAMSLV